MPMATPYAWLPIPFGMSVEPDAAGLPLDRTPASASAYLLQTRSIDRRYRIQSGCGRWQSSAPFAQTTGPLGGPDPNL